MKPRVSIIIPTFNREHLIVETLESLLNQTYKHWECIIIDDGSTDDSEKVIESFINSNHQFQYYKRPNIRPKGANACRNIGLEKANGHYVIFFDSDDLMQPNHIEVKINAILKYDCDYVITQTEFFNYPEGNVLLETNYDFETTDITAYNYIAQKINWLTLDTCISANVAKAISFNEKLQSGQEYNYFSKLTLKSTNAVYIKKVVTLRRHHEDSIRGKLRTNGIKNAIGFYNTYWYTYLETKLLASKSMRIVLIHRCAIFAKKIPFSEIPYRKKLFKFLIEELGLKGVYHIIQIKLKGEKHLEKG